MNNLASRYSMCFVMVVLVSCASGQSTARTCERDWLRNTFDPETTSRVQQFLLDLKSTLKSSDKHHIAAMISYPALVHGGAGTTARRRQIRNQTQLISQFDTIFTARVRRVIETEPIECVRGNANGFMLGNGDVWFNERPDGTMKIITIYVGE